MKKLVISCSAILVTTCLFVSCRSTSENNSKTAEIGTTKMTRTRTASGLEYEIKEEGNGASAQSGDTVKVHYTGWLDNDGQLGKKFDSSRDRNQPFSFRIDGHQVIAGWDEGVKGMKVGEQRRLFIPSHLGYGARGAGGVIPANANLIFDVELISIQ